MIDTEKIRKDFPMYAEHDSAYKGQPLHYLDSGATSFKPYSVIEAEQSYYSDYSSNVHRGDYVLANTADKEYEGARKRIASFINADPDEVCFTSGDTFGMNQVANGVGEWLHEGDEIILSYHEHASNVLPWFKVAQRKGAVIKYVPLDETGRITAENLRKTVTERTKVVSFASVTNVLGYKIDEKEFAKIAHSVGALYVSDGAQSVAHQKTDVKDTDVDFFVFSGHKMLGPSGIGVMYGKRKLLKKLNPLCYGGEMNSRFYEDTTFTLVDPPLRFEAGTPNVAGAIGLAKACDYLEGIGFDAVIEHEERLRQLAVEELSKLDNVVIYNKDAEAGIVTFNVKDVFAQDAATYLGSKGVYVRSGTHCAKLLPLFLGEPATIRASLYIYNDEGDIHALVEAVSHAEDYLDVYFN